jgi:hypothetical protein
VLQTPVWTAKGLFVCVLIGCGSSSPTDKGDSAALADSAGAASDTTTSDGTASDGAATPDVAVVADGAAAPDVPGAPLEAGVQGVTAVIGGTFIDFGYVASSARSVPGRIIFDTTATTQGSAARQLGLKFGVATGVATAEVACDSPDFSLTYSDPTGPYALDVASKPCGISLTTIPSQGKGRLIGRFEATCVKVGGTERLGVTGVIDRNFLLGGP